MNYQTLYLIDRNAFNTPRKRERVLNALPNSLKVLVRLTGNPKVDRFLCANSKHSIYKDLVRKAILEAQIKKDLYWVCILGTNIKPKFMNI